MSDTPRTTVNQLPGGGTNYPFTTPTVLEGVVLDFYLSYDDPTCSYVLPFRLSITDVTVTVFDANDVVVAEGVCTVGLSRTWGTREVWEFISDPWVMRLVTVDFVDGDGILDARTYNRLPARVRSLRVGLLKLTEALKFEAGYNISLTGTDTVERNDGGRFNTVINLDAIPGAGAGKLNGCDDVAPVVRKINRISPSCNGNFVIETDDCFRAQLPLLVSGGSGEARTAEYSADDLSGEEAKAALRLTSDCYPCCDCDYFVRTYKGLKRVRSRWFDAANVLEQVRDTYEENRARWMESRQCRLDNPARLVTSTAGNCKNVIGGSYCNGTTCCLSALELRFTLQRYTDGVLVDWAGGSPSEAYIMGSSTDGEEPYVPLIQGPVIRFFFDYADPQAISVAKMKFCVTSCLATESLKVTFTVHVAQPEPNTVTGDLCTLSEVEISEELLAIWAAEDISDVASVRTVLTKTAALNPNRPTFNCEC